MRRAAPGRSPAAPPPSVGPARRRLRGTPGVPRGLTRDVARVPAPPPGLARALGLALVALLSVGLAASCRSTYPSTMPEDTGRTRVSRGVPDWVGEPLSWDKLAEVETWLATEADRSTDYWRIEAMLTLAEGRLEFSLQDRETGRRGEPTIRQRLSLARQGFQDVVDDPAATSDQERSARSGLAAVDRFGQPAPASATRALAYVPRASWGALAPRPSRLTRATGRWTKITVHHSAEANAPALDGTAASSAEALRRIQRHMMNGLDYGDIGYHLVIDPQGRVFEGRSLAWQGAHASGRNNVENIGVCVLGNFEHSTPTPQALAALELTLDSLRATHRIPRSGVVAHRDLKNTLCPGRALTAWLRRY